jgi:hypothetical protein
MKQVATFSFEGVMKIPILIDPLSTGGFQAKSGEPFGLTAEGATADEAAHRLQEILRQRLRAGSRLALIDLRKNSVRPLDLSPVPEDDWLFPAMNEAIAENRRREDEAGE